MTFDRAITTRPRALRPTDRQQTALRAAQRSRWRWRLPASKDEIPQTGWSRDNRAMIDTT